MTYVVGIDPSLTSTGLCVFYDSGEIATHTLGSSPAEGLSARFTRYDGLLRDVAKHIGSSAHLIAIEGYSFDSRGGKAFDRVEYGALLRKDLSFRCDCLIEVPPSSLKLFAAGKGNANKTAMALAVFKRWGREFPDDNQVDAYALARMAACIAGFDQPQTDAQKRAIDSVLHGKPKKPKKPQPAE